MVDNASQTASLGAAADAAPPSGDAASGEPGTSRSARPTQPHAQAEPAGQAKPACQAKPAGQARPGGPAEPGGPAHPGGWAGRLEALGLRVTRGPGSGGPLRREIDGSLLGGVAAGIAKRTGFDVSMVRALIVVAALATSGFCRGRLRGRVAADPGRRR